MDFPKLDKVRRSAAPLQLDVVDAYVAGRLSRREFIQRGAIVGLSMGSIGMVIAACGGTTHLAVGQWRRRDVGRELRREQRPIGGRLGRSPAASSGSPPSVR